MTMENTTDTKLPASPPFAALAGSAFSAWWDDTGQHLPQNNLELAQDAWNAALDDAEKCIVPDGNPMVALGKIKRLKI